MRIRVLADDLTGAIDGAAPFVRAGLRATLALTRASGACGTRDAMSSDVLACSTDTRCTEDGPAAQSVLEHLQAHPVLPHDVLVKKIDSLLRGPWGAEVDAALLASGKRLAVVCPALPRMQRSLRGGVLWNHHAPVPHGQLFAGEPSRAPQAALQSCGDRLGWHHRQAESAGPLPEQGVLLFDAQTDAHLDALVAAYWPRRHDVLWVGSSGLTAAIARHGAPHAPALLRQAPPKPLVLAVGTRSQYTTEQLNYLWQQAPWQYATCAPGAARVARCGRVTVVYPPEEDLAPAVATARIAELALACARAGQRERESARAEGDDHAHWLAIVGGNTLAAALERLRADHMGILGSAHAGFEALQWQPPGPHRPLEIWSRSGRFGVPDDLWQLCRDHVTGTGTHGCP
jgi:uncharacterized protein YgbK (DUF1537 family)